MTLTKLYYMRQTFVLYAANHNIAWGEQSYVMKQTIESMLEAVYLYCLP